MLLSANSHFVNEIAFLLNRSMKFSDISRKNIVKVRIDLWEIRDPKRDRLIVFLRHGSSECNLLYSYDVISSRRAELNLDLA